MISFFVEVTSLYFMFVLLLLIICSLMFLYFQNKLYSQRRHILLLTNQNNSLRGKKYNNIIIKYYNCQFKYGFTKETCSINLAPIDENLCICKLEKNTTIDILNLADVNGDIWYEVQVPSKDKVNNKGWLRATQIVFPEIINKIYP